MYLRIKKEKLNGTSNFNKTNINNKTNLFFFSVVQMFSTHEAKTFGCEKFITLLSLF